MADLNDRELLHSFVDDLADYAIVVLDIAGKIRTWNAGARALLGYTAVEVGGWSFSALWSAANPGPGFDASISDAVRWGRHETTGQLMRKDGTAVEVRLVLRPLSDSSLSVIGFGLIAHTQGSPRIAVVSDKPGATAAPSRGKANILVVDDNQGVLGVAVDQLTSLGYRVIAASSGAEALEMLRRDPVDLLFTDVVMPGDLAGRTLAAKAMEIRPGLKVLFSSGYFEGALVGKGQLETDVQFLAKPYRKQELGQKIEEVLKTPSER
jgi:PAS domain S-box-containing protein